MAGGSCSRWLAGGVRALLRTSLLLGGRNEHLMASCILHAQAKQGDAFRPAITLWTKEPESQCHPLKPLTHIATPKQALHCLKGALAATTLCVCEGKALGCLLSHLQRQLALPLVRASDVLHGHGRILHSRVAHLQALLPAGGAHQRGRPRQGLLANKRGSGGQPLVGQHFCYVYYELNVSIPATCYSETCE
eukprot:1160700-Pelagomonas_calceolata.AAC.2